MEEIETPGQNNFSEEYNKFHELWGRVFLAYSKERQGEYNKQVTNFANQLKNKYPDYTKYALYHGLVGGTPPKDCIKFDFPEEDSVLNFLKHLEEQLK